MVVLKYQIEWATLDIGKKFWRGELGLQFLCFEYL